jgi:hypothetical protein
MDAAQVIAGFSDRRHSGSARVDSFPEPRIAAVAVLSVLKLSPDGRTTSGKKSEFGAGPSPGRDYETLTAMRAEKLSAKY